METRYAQVIRTIEHLISQGILRAGQRVPSIRQMRQKLGVSSNTVIRAYESLEAKGILEGVSRSGYFVRDFFPRLTTPLEPTKPSSRSLDSPDHYLFQFILGFSNETSYWLSEMQQSRHLLPEIALRSALSSAQRQALLTDFVSLQGLRRLREKIVLHAAPLIGGLSCDEIVVTNGGVESWNLCLGALTQPGDAVLVQPISYIGVRSVIRSRGGIPVDFPFMPNGEIDETKLRKILETQLPKVALIFPNSVDLKGRTLSERARRQIISALEPHGVVIIEDGMYSDHILTPRNAPSIRAFAGPSRVIYCGSFSKSVAPGLRVAWIASGDWLEAILYQKFITSVSTAGLNQHLVSYYLREKSQERHLRKVRRELPGLIAQHEKFILKNFPKGTRFVAPEAGPTAWVFFPIEIDSRAVFLKALEREILIAPEVLYSDSLRPDQPIHLNCGSPLDTSRKNVLSIIGALAEESCHAG